MAKEIDPNNVCPFCDKPLSSKRTLRDHVLRKHDGVAVVGGTHVFHAVEFTSAFKGELWSIRCWCNRAYHSRGGLATHWHARGGLHAHLLEIALGGER